VNKNKVGKPFVCLALFLFAGFFAIPWIAYIDTIRSVFLDWTLVAVELVMLVALVATLFFAFILDPSRRDQSGNINLSWPP
jgi:hypothetical protein